MDPVAVREELERILASKWFAKSQGLDVLLRFLAENAIAGGPPLNEYVIAARVFGRSGSFTPQIDPVVRVRYRRLRTALFDFYEAEGCPGAVLLDASEDGFGLVVMKPAAGRGARRRRRNSKNLVVLAAVAVAAVGGGAWLHFAPRREVARQAAQIQAKARDLLAQETQSSVALSVPLFEKAVALDSGSAQSWSGLANALVMPGSAGDMSRDEALARARTAAQKALALNPAMGQPHAVLAYVKLFLDSDWPGAEGEFHRAAELEPSAPRTHWMYAQGLMSRGRFDDAIAQSRLAASLEPAGSPPPPDLTEILCAAHRYDEAIAEARRDIQQTGGAPGARLSLGLALSAAGHYDEAIPELQAVILTTHSIYALARLGYAYGAKGDRVAAQSVLDRLGHAFVDMAMTDWSYLALVYAGMGENNYALTCLEKAAAHREGDLIFIGIEPAYDRLHSEPRFVALKKRLGLP